MRILVVSDSHRQRYNLFSAIEAEPTAEVVFFLGDGASEFEEARLAYSPEKAFIGVRGNCDFGSDLPERDIRTVGGIKIFATHGYVESVKFGLGGLIAKACENDCKLALFGHTHKPEVRYIDGIHYFNPGSIRDGSYGVVDITDNGIICINKKL